MCCHTREHRRLDLTRALVTYETVVSKLLDNGIGYVRLSGFSGTTTRDMMSAIRAMKQQNGGGLRGLILDMRGNPGGLLEQAIQVSDAFVEEGTIVTTVGVNGTLREPKLARADGAERERGGPPKVEDVIDEVADGLTRLIQIAERIDGSKDCVRACEEGFQHFGWRGRRGGLSRDQLKTCDQNERPAPPCAHTLQG